GAKQSTPANRTAESKANQRSHRDSQARRSAYHSRTRNLRSLFRSSSWFLHNGFGLCQLGDSLTCQSKYSPFIQRLSAERAIKLDRRFIPIEDGPFHPPAGPIARDLCKIDKQCPAITFATLLRFHEEICEIKSGSPKPRGEIAKENSKP